MKQIFIRFCFYRVRFFLALAACVFPMIISSCFGSCGVYPGAEGALENTSLSIATWNMQALFDGKDDGWEYEEYRAGSGWSEEKYNARLNHIAEAIKGMGENSPDIIALIELENKNILEKLGSEYLAQEAYKYYFFAGNTGYSLGIGILSKYPFSKATAHSINVDGEIIPRPITEVEFSPKEENIILFACHWKSKLGGDEKTEALRREAARLILRRQKEIRQENPKTPILVLGDLNENYDEFYRRSGQVICALMPDDPEAARIAGYLLLETDGESSPKENSDVQSVKESDEQDFLIISEEKPPVSSFFVNCTGVFYSPWCSELKNGSYFYSGGWETIDHFLLNEAFFNTEGWQFKDCFVMDTEPFVNSKGEPNLYNARTGSGLSDHLPLLLRLYKAKKIPPT
ncbi:MAG: endonuclease/exonuclease/phosphatase family protein [Spirochaetaceae bacterium]|jgi:endonuclease/exonuclease/phosphatase family metal-dependent hydrolase|nr:endonuclease/exonuclease/phosphatase family protein [Spirochaetaceae bacterium]